MSVYVGLDVELETNVIVEEGERRRLFVDRSRQDFADTDDNVINVAAGEIQEARKNIFLLTSQNNQQKQSKSPNPLPFFHHFD